MHLLVSVMDPREVPAAVEGGAHIIDVKDASRGPLGRPPARIVSAVRAALTPPRLMSVALGDATTPSDEITTAVRELAGHDVDFMKVGLLGGSSQAARLLRDLVEAAGNANHRARVVAVVYADAPQADGLSPLSLPALAAAAGAHGVMLDTFDKSDGTSLLKHMQEPSLLRFVTLARSFRLLSGLAGSLGPEGIARLRDVAPDVVGVRGAACEGGRTGRVSAARVRRLVQLTRPLPPLSGVTASHSRPDGSAFEK